MALFDAYVMVDWSAAASPTTGRDSIWYACYRRDGGVLERSLLVNAPTRAAATAELIALFAELIGEGRRVLAGFDFPFGYPAGTARALQLDGVPWKAMWEHLAEQIRDDGANANNRFAVGAGFNRRISGGGFPFWGSPHNAAPHDGLPRRKPRPHGEREPAEWRLAERRHRSLNSVWQLAYTGSVGSQSLMGIPRVRQIRNHPKLARSARIWPFETGLRTLSRPTKLVLAEIYPSLVPPHDHPGLPKDAGQVTAMAERLGALDDAGRLAALFAGDPGLMPDERRAVETEEAWVLGLGARAAVDLPADRETAPAYDYVRDGAAITRDSIAIVERECDFSRFASTVRPVLARIVQACGMTEIAPDLVVSGDVTAVARTAMAAGRPVFCDAVMVGEGIRRAALPAGVRVTCTLRHARVPARAAKLQTTRSAAAVDLWGPALDGAIVAIGNAPTALFRLLEIIAAGGPRPALILGFPVGFVGAVESKEALIADADGIPYITLRGRRGGSAMAAAAVNALRETAP